MASLQGALPNMAAPTNLLRTSILPTAHPSAGLPNAPSYASVMPSNTNMMPQLPGNMPARGHGQVNFGHHMGGLQSLPAAPNNFSSVGENPFG